MHYQTTLPVLTVPVNNGLFTYVRNEYERQADPRSKLKLSIPKLIHAFLTISQSQPGANGKFLG